MSITAYVDHNTIRKDDDSLYAGMSLVTLGDKKARFMRMAKDIFIWAIKNRVERHVSSGPKRHNVIVISRNMSEQTYLSDVLGTLASRDYKIVFLEPAEVSDPKSELRFWSSVITVGEPFFQIRRQYSRSRVENFSKTGVFWDVEDCPIPRSLQLDPDLIVKNIQSGLAIEGYLGMVSTFWAYKTKVPKQMFLDYNAAEITLSRG